MLTVPGPVRSYHLGPRVLDRLEAAGPETELGQRLLEDMRRVQHMDVEDLYEASVLRLSRKDPEDSFDIAVLAAC